MLALLIKIPNVTVDYSYADDKMQATIAPAGDIWINAEKIIDIRVQDEDSNKWTRISLEGDGHAYTSLSPEQIIALIDAARKELV